jgi:hypothetical protein
MNKSKTSNVRMLGLFLALFGLVGTIVNAADSYLTRTRGTLIIYATCDGIDFAKLSVKDGIAAAIRLKTTFNAVSLSTGHEIIRKLNYTGPMYTPSSIRTSTKVGVFTGAWLKELEWAESFDIFFIRDRDIATRTPREQAWFDALLETWEMSFVHELLQTGRPGFVRAQRCSLRYDVKMY